MEKVELDGSKAEWTVSKLAMKKREYNHQIKNIAQKTKPI